ncbi:LuxR C-terminal-related transcriptional regulator [Burkholderia anthina]|uniref:LuxR C-terminal-related transcriptional regulator n=1 Tax=Burkholderia anthina TaxID=179879 RepID=UPI001CF2D521|nr:LuxR C-terminal-related transcriptional regulator [Burkholderia anthina]MCA8094813.1 LuxR C-terminal-related transcriptional regulator [Burkholderia anthina]
MNGVPGRLTRIHPIRGNHVNVVRLEALNSMNWNNWSRGRLAPPDFGFERVPTRAFALLRARVLPRLTVVTAPPGYGKTVLLSAIYRWLRSGDERCLWLSLDERERDVRSVLALLRQALTDASQTTDDRHAQPASLVADPVDILDPNHALEAIVGDLRQLRGRTILFIDNLDVCIDPMVSAFIERLTFHRVPDVRLVVSSVRNLPIDFVRMKLEVDGLLLGPDQLGFNRDETRQLFSLSGFAGLDDRAVQEIHAHTEGWPAAVRLAQVLMSEQRQFPCDTASAYFPPTPLRDFNGDRKDISRVLTERVLSIIDPARVNFLMEVALVREFNVELAECITGNPNARDWLDDLLQRNLLIFSIGVGRRWFRLHTLLRDYLLQEAKDRLSPARRSEVLKNAARWYEDRKDYVSALGSALEAPDVKRAENLIGRIARHVAADCGQMSLFVEWTEKLLSLGGDLPVQAQGWYVWALCHLMQYEKAGSALEMLDRRMSEYPAPPSTALETADLSFLRIVLAVSTDALDAAHDEALAWLNDTGHYDPLQVGTVTAVAALAALDRGDLAESERHLDAADGAIERSHSIFLRAWIGILRSALALSRARPDLADRILGNVRARVLSEIGESSPVLAIIDSVHARALTDQGKFADARVPLERSMQPANHFGVPMTTELGLGACVAMKPDGEIADATDSSLDEIARRYAPRIMTLLSAQRIRRRLHAGIEADTDSIELAGRVIQSGNRTHATGMRERSDWLLVGIELTIAKGLFKQAHDTIDAAMRLATTQGRTSDRVSLLLASMDAYARAGRKREATRALSRAIDLAHTGSLVYPFILYQRAVGKLIAKASARDFALIRPAEIDFLDRLHAICGQSQSDEDGDATRAFNSAAGPVDVVQPLTLRETQLLRLVNEGLSNQTLADQLSLSLPTVKWHLRNLYGKLGVRNRSAALAKARAYGLLN